MRIIGLLACVFLLMLVFGRIFGRDALLVISVSCNLIVLGLRIRMWITAKIAAHRREEAGR